MLNCTHLKDDFKRKKIKRNSTFMSSEEFQEALRTRKCFVHPLYLAAYKSGNFSNVLLADSIHKLKKHITK